MTLISTITELALLAGDLQKSDIDLQLSTWHSGSTFFYTFSTGYLAVQKQCGLWSRFQPGIADVHFDTLSTRCRNKQCGLQNCN